MSALAVIQKSSDLLSLYALWTQERDVEFESEASALTFLMWRIAFGAKTAHSCQISGEIFNLITAPAAPFLTRLEQYLFEISDRGKAGPDKPSISTVHKWYYTYGMQQTCLWPLLTLQEIQSLSTLSSLVRPQDSRLSLLDEIVWANSAFMSMTFDLTSNSGTDAFLAWMDRHGFSHCAPWFPVAASPGLQSRRSVGLPAAGRAYAPATEPLIGVNLIGYADSVLGLGEDIRSLKRTAHESGVRANIVSVDIPAEIGTPLSDGRTVGRFPKPIFPVSLFCMPLAETERYRLSHSASFQDAAYRIGHWPWELSSLPNYWKQAFNFVDEIWAISPFVESVYKQFTQKPVMYMPPLVDVCDLEDFDISQIGVEQDAFVYLALFDLNSFIERKNPIGVIEAFQIAFPNRSSQERLVIKTLNGHARDQELKIILDAAAMDPRIIVIDGSLSRPETLGLIRAADCFVSLHRSEGFGRVLAEAMLLGTPVIATNYSGVTAFFDEATGFPVNYKLIPVKTADYPYSEGSYWADPDVFHAAEQMRRVREGDAEVRQRIRAANSRIDQNHSLAQVARNFRSRIDQVLESL